jgi:hypothetical protein
VTKETPPLTAGQILTGPLFNEPMRVETVQSNGTASWIVGLVGANSERFRKVTMSAEDLLRLTVLDPKHSFNGDGRLLRLGLQAIRPGDCIRVRSVFRPLNLACRSAATSARGNLRLPTQTRACALPAGR